MPYKDILTRELYHRNYYLKNKEKQLKWLEEDRKNFPWKYALSRIKQRCTNTKDKAYKYYGGRGIKCLITEEELKFLWFRDEAWKLDKPSIDRKDNDKNYEVDNCRFIEMIENIAEKNKRYYQNLYYNLI